MSTRAASVIETPSGSLAEERHGGGERALLELRAGVRHGDPNRPGFRAIR